MEKCRRQFEYEELFKNRNFLIEWDINFLYFTILF
jgi:hypothetical protein